MLIKSPENFTPKNFEEFLGQKQAKKMAQVIVSAAKIQKRNLPNVIIDGEYGLGKTTLAKVMLNEVGQPIHLYDAQAVNVEIPSVRGTIIIDEIHNLSAQVADSLNVEIDKGKVSIVGCTTNPGALSSAFRSRFRSIHLERYTDSELTTILDIHCLRSGIRADREILTKVAKRSRFNPRIGINYLSTMTDLMVTKGANVLTKSICEEGFKLVGVDDKGLMIRDYEYLLAFPPDGRPVGIQFLSAKLGIDPETITREIEPYLLQIGFIDRTPKGRVRVV